MEKILNNRGQGIAVDLVFAVLIFLLVAGGISWVWSSKSAESEKQNREAELQLMAERALDTLVRSQGIPQDWETKGIDDANFIGLAKTNLLLDEAKINRLTLFADGNHEKTKQKLLIGANDYYFRLTDPAAGTIVKNSNGEPMTVGEEPEESALQATVRRPVAIAYKREGEEEATLHEANAELTLSFIYDDW